MKSRFHPEARAEYPVMHGSREPGYWKTRLRQP
jgi:hypothetical protein